MDVEQRYVRYSYTSPSNGISVILNYFIYYFILQSNNNKKLKVRTMEGYLEIYLFNSRKKRKDSINRITTYDSMYLPSSPCRPSGVRRQTVTLHDEIL